MITIDFAIDQYLSRGFGSMNKNDFEVWIFNQLLQGRLKGKSNYEISRALNLPENKVKRLRYEADLKYSSEQDIENRLYDILNHALSKAYLKVIGKDVQIQFIIEDLSVRKFLDYKLKKNGFFSDSSFNSEIVSVRSEGLKFLYECTPNGKSAFEIFEKTEKAKSGNKGPNWFLECLKSLASGIGNGIGVATVNLSITGLMGTI